MIEVNRLGKSLVLLVLFLSSILPLFISADELRYYDFRELDIDLLKGLACQGSIPGFVIISLGDDDRTNQYYSVGQNYLTQGADINALFRGKMTKGGEALIFYNGHEYKKAANHDELKEMIGLGLATKKPIRYKCK